MTAVMSTHIEMNLEGFQVIKSAIAELTERVVKDNFSSFTEFSLPQMSLNIILIIKWLLCHNASAIVKTDLAE